MIDFHTRIVLNIVLYQYHINQTSLVGQWLRLCASIAGGMDLIPDQGTKIPHAMGQLSL